MSHSKEHAGVSGHNDAGGAAGFFGGDVLVSGNISNSGNQSVGGNLSVTGNHTVGGQVTVTGDIVLVAADCAEEFAVSMGDRIDPGTVMVIDDQGCVQPGCKPYDRRAAGVISGAGDLRPGLILHKLEEGNRVPIAMIGTVNCKVDARYGAVEVGDLLTTSPTWGHAMKANDPGKAFGAVIGKALRPLKEGQGLIPILVALQ